MGPVVNVSAGTVDVTAIREPDHWPPSTSGAGNLSRQVGIAIQHSKDPSMVYCSEPGLGQLLPFLEAHSVANRGGI